MELNVFDLDFTRYKIVLLFLAPALINFLIVGYVILFMNKSRMNSVFLAFVSMVGLWQVFEGFVRLSVTKEVALEWYRLEGLVIIIATLFGLLFILHFTQWYKKLGDKIVFSFLILPTIIFLIVIILKLDSYVIQPSPKWYWIINPVPVPVTYMIYLWSTIEGLLMLTLPLLFLIKNKTDKSRKRQALLLTIGLGVPVLGGIITETVFPLLLSLDNIPMTAPLMTVFSVFALIAIHKHNMLDYSPKHQWENIIESMNEGLLIVNNDDVVMYANHTFCVLMGYESNEITGKIAKDLFISNSKYKTQIEFENEQRKKEISSQYEIELITKEGKKIWVLISGSPYYDKKGKIIGSIGILTNTNQLKAKEAHLKHIIETSKIVIIDVDFLKNTVFLSENSKEVLGIDPSTFDIPSTIKKYIHPDDIEMVTNSIKRMVRKKDVDNLEFRWIHPDVKKTIWIERRSETITNVHGKVIGTRGLLIDISERKKNEEATITLSNHLKQAQTMANLGSWEADLKNHETTWSDEVYEIFGVKKEEVIPSLKLFLSFIHPGDTSYVIELMDRSEKSLQGYSFNSRIIRKDGILRYVYSDCRFILDRNGKPMKIYGIIHDITERQKAEEKLRYSETRLKQAQAIAHVGNWELNFASNSSKLSDEAYRIYGIEPGDHKFSTEGWMTFVHPDDFDYVKSEIESAQSAFSDSSFYHRIVRPDGVVRWVYSETKFEFNAEGKPIGLYGVVHDVTEKRKSEEDLKAANKELETYIYKASHDLRAPITSILGLTHISKFEIDDPKAFEYLVMIEKSAKKLDDTLIGLVQSMNIKDTKQFSDLIGFEQIIKETITKYELRKEYSTINISSSVRNSHVFVSNKYIIESIFQNLIENAIKYQRTTKDNSFLKIIVSDSLGGVEIKFEDNGIGIDDDQKDKVFEMYYRATAISTGSGLGLYLVKLGIEKLKGTLNFESHKNAGTTFILNLPNLC